MCLKFGFVIFWQKDLGTKAAHKMLVKLTPGHPDYKRKFKKSLEKNVKSPIMREQMNFPSPFEIQGAYSQNFLEYLLTVFLKKERFKFGKDNILRLF